MSDRTSWGLIPVAVVSPCQIHVQVLTSSASGCDLIWKYGPFRCKQLRRGHTGVGWAANPMRLAFLSKGEMRTDRSTGKMRGDASRSPGTPKVASQAPEAGQEVLRALQKEAAVLTLRSQTSSLQNQEQMNFCCKPPSSWYPVTAAPVSEHRDYSPSSPGPPGGPLDWPHSLFHSASVLGGNCQLYKAEGREVTRPVF